MTVNGWKSNLRNSRTYARYISRLVLRPEDRASTDASNPAESYEQSAAQGPLPLAAYIVGLISQSSGDIGIRARCHEEDAEISGVVGAGETHDWKADESDEGIDDEDGATDVVTVA